MSDSTQNPPPPDEPQYSSPPPPPPPSASESTPPPTAPPTAQQPGAQPMGAAGGGVGQPADLLTRFLARLIDGVLLFIVLFVINGVILTAFLAGAGTGSFGFGTGSSFAFSAVSAILTAAIYLGYFAVMESRTGQTLGKMLLKLETRGPGGGKPTLEQAVKRNAWTALGLLGLVPILGWLLSLLAQLAAVITIAVTINNNSATRQGWHDNFAGGTTVYKVG